jgi:hypothetical protein
MTRPYKLPPCNKTKEWKWLHVTTDLMYDLCVRSNSPEAKKVILDGINSIIECYEVKPFGWKALLNKSYCSLIDEGKVEGYHAECEDGTYLWVNDKWLTREGEFPWDEKEK